MDEINEINNELILLRHRISNLSRSLSNFVAVTHNTLLLHVDEQTLASIRVLREQCQSMDEAVYEQFGALTATIKRGFPEWKSER